MAAKSYFGNLGRQRGGGVHRQPAAPEHGRLFPILNYRTPDAACPVSAVRNGDVPPGELINLSARPNARPSACAGAAV